MSDGWAHCHVSQPRVRGREPRAIVVAKTFAKQPNGVTGTCIAAISLPGGRPGGRLIRLASLHGSASPFWTVAEVAIKVLTRVNLY
jgi:hypothetical protein